MRESWLIGIHYLGRISRKPWLVAFLFALPLLLLSAEFAAFGRSSPIERLTSPRLVVVQSNLSKVERGVLSCMDGKPGHPIEFLEGAGFGDRLVFERGGMAPPKIQFASGTSEQTRLLESSILKLCVTPPHALTTPIVIARSNHGAINKNPNDFLVRFSPGLALFGALFLSQAMASLVWRDQERAGQRRLLTLPIWQGAVAVGPLLYLTLGVTCALTIMLSATSFAANLPPLRAPLVWIVALGFGLFAAGLQLSIGLWAGSQRAAQAVSASTSMMLAFFGGGFVPLQLYPPFLRTVACVLPNGAAQAGLSQLLEGSGTHAGLALRTATVWIWAGVLLAAAMFLQQRKSR